LILPLVNGSVQALAWPWIGPAIALHLVSQGLFQVLRSED
jgi:hypothetical protein